ncbi:hypothetical protein [uncultured Arthrobacter sp.]|uniref:hypothetical protein n=1 Tax=uncultured Arthrobacter sp. TaxID=114050 RepID=UPI0025EE15AE|nr:hypothetical protein [uncultured Arthrobacter sp.]
MTEDKAEDITRVPFWIVLAGVSAGAFWALVGVAVGSRLSRRRDRAVPGGVRTKLLPWQCTPTSGPRSRR